MACTSTTITTRCATCGDSIETTLDSDGTVDACYGSIITGHTDRFNDDATSVEEHLDDNLPDNHIACVYAECEDCCPICSDPDASHDT